MILRKESMTNRAARQWNGKYWVILFPFLVLDFFVLHVNYASFPTSHSAAFLKFGCSERLRKYMFVISTLFLLKEKNHFRISGILSKSRMFIDNICFLVFSNKIMKLQIFILLTTLRMQDIHSFSPCSKLLAYSEQAFLSSWSRLKCM